MSTTGKRIIERIIAIVIILTMTMADFCLVGERVISYAADLIQINSKNVAYNVYFANENKTIEATASTDDKNLKIGIEVSVKNDGYLENGKIEIEENANFKFSKIANNEYVKSVEDKAIYLNQINEGDNITIEAQIEFANAEEMSADYLSKNSMVKLSGSYTNSSNVNKDKTEIEGIAYVKINWQSPSETKSELKADLLTNYIYSVDGVEKRIVQTLITSNVANNSYPVKDTNIEVEIPNSPETVTVHKRTTSATNGDREFNYEYNNGKLTITAQNGGDNKISWAKNAKDIFVVTAEYSTDVEVTNSKMEVNSTITTYDDKELKANTEIIVNQEKDSAVSVEEIENQSDIEKGKIYAGEEKNYKTTSNVYIDYAKAVDTIVIEEKESTFLSQNKEEIKANIEYVQTSIDKNQFTAIFGEEGTIQIEDQDGNIIGTEIDGESGKIIAKYNEGTTSLKITTSAPQTEGTLKIENEKKILDSELNREEIKELVEIKDDASYIKESMIAMNAAATLALKETSSKASLEVEPTALTTSQDEHKLTIRVTLETNSEDRDLFKNPVIKIKLPNQITSISANYSLINANGLTFNEDGKGIKQENGNLIMTIPLKGEQTSYPGEAVKGTELLIEATVKLNKLATNSDEEIVLHYTNENATKYADNGEQKVNIKIQAQDLMILTNDLTDENEKAEIETTGNQGEKEVALDINSSAKTKKLIMRVANNEDADISDVKILGKIANIDGKITRASGIRTSKSEGVTVYYTTVESPTADINSADNKWTKTASADAKNYLIVLDTLKKGDYIRFSYDISIEKDLSYNLSTETEYTVYYTNSLTGKEKQAQSTKIILTTGKVAELKTALTAQVGGEELKEGDEVKAGEIITYTATISNTGREKAEGVNITATIPENTTLVSVNPDYPIKEGVTPDEATSSEPYLIEKSDKQLVKQNTVIEAGEKAIYTYMVRVNSDLAETKEIESKVVAKFGDIQEQSIIKNKVSNAQIRATFIPTGRKAAEQLTSGENYIYAIEIENLTDKEQKNVQVTINKNALISIATVYCSSGEDYYEQFDEEKLSLTIPSIAAKSTASVEMDTLINPHTKDLTLAEMSATIKDDDGNAYRTNKLSETVKGVTASIYLEASTKSENYIKAGDEIKYTIKVKNTSEYDAEALAIKDRFSDYLELEKITLNGQEVEYSKESNFGEGINYNTLSVSSTLKANQEATLEITAKVDEEIETMNVLKVVNKAFVYNNEIQLAETDEQAYYIEPLVDQEVNVPDDGNNENNNSDNQNEEAEEEQEEKNNSEENNNNENQESSVTKYIISGTAWKDADQNGSRDSGESLLEGVKVYAINAATNKVIATTTTNSDGFYTISLPKAQYIVAFEYDTEKYVVTKYQAEGISSEKNSDAVKASRIVDGEEKTLAFTDTINLIESKANINLGLTDAKVFSLELEKVISKMIVTNNSGTKTYDFEDTDLAKVEIAGKNLNNSNVVIEYKIKVTNNGEVAGYAKSIVDYIPSSLTFNSNLNSDWYKKGNNIYTSALADTKIEPGETKEIKLVLTKKMTESNTGLTNNKAEIETSYNSLGIANAASSENLSSEQVAKKSADAIIGVSTGATVSYIALTLTIIIIICGAAYLVNKKLLVEKIEI